MSKRQSSSKAEDSVSDEGNGLKELTDVKEEGCVGEKKAVEFEVDDTVGGLPNGNVPHSHPPELIVGEGR